MAVVMSRKRRRYSGKLPAPLFNLIRKSDLFRSVICQKPSIHKTSAFCTSERWASRQEIGPSFGRGRLEQNENCLQFTQSDFERLVLFRGASELPPPLWRTSPHAPFK
jgi:hypothetical protein